MTQTGVSIKSILAVDCGNVSTTALLIELVEGHFQLAATGRATSTHTAPWQDMVIGVQQAIQQIERTTKRTLLASGNWPINPRNTSGQGVDAFIVVSSAGTPLPVALVGLAQDISLASARRAVAMTYASVTNELSLDSGQRSADARIQALREGQPETILLVGGADGGAERPVTELANVVSMAVQLLQSVKKPNILFAGNSQARTHVAQILQPVANLGILENVRPTLEKEQLVPVQTELEKIYTQRRMARLPGYDKLSKWSNWPIIPTSKSFERVMAYLGQQHALNVIGVDVGSSATQIAAQTHDYHTSAVRTDAGVGHGLAGLLKKTSLEKFQRWLPFEMSLEMLHNHLLNKSLHPASVPTDEQSLMIEYAIAREAIRLTMTHIQAAWRAQTTVGRYGPQWHWLIGGGQTLTGPPNLGYAALMLLDGTESWGVTKLSLDVGKAANVLGSIAAVEPAAAVEVAAHHSTFLNLGTVIAPLGHGPLNKTAVKLKFVDEAANTEEFNVPYGTIQLIDLPPGKKATLEMRPTRFFDIGLGQPGRGAVAEVEGGLLGLIIDARGRPLRLAQNENRRWEQLVQWLTALRINS